ncbi:hypothetical protein [Streptomyces chartreusis]
MISPDEADEWVRSHFADEPDPQVEIVFEVTERPNPAAYSWLLEFLFAPRPEGREF